MAKSVIFKVLLIVGIIISIPIFIFFFDSAVKIIFNLGRYFGTFIRSIFNICI